MGVFGITLLVLVLAAVVVLVANIKIVSQSEAYVVEQLGQYKATWKTGLHVVIPILYHAIGPISLKEQIIDIDSGEDSKGKQRNVITMDGIIIEVEAVVFYQVKNPELYVYSVEKPEVAIEKLTRTNLRNVIGGMNLDQLSTARNRINLELREELNKVTEPWGIDVCRVEVKRIDPPRDIQETMEQELKAEHDGRVKRLRAEANAAAIRLEAQAKADSIRMISDAKASEEYIQMESLKAFGKAADGKATKIIIPSEIQGFAALAKGLSEVVSES